MKHIILFLALVVLCAVTVWGEHQIIVSFGLGFLFIAAVSGLTAFIMALYRAPEGWEDGNGFCVRRYAQPAMQIRRQRSSRLIRARP